MTKDTVKIHGKDYETVASRVARFRETYKQEYSITTELVARDETTVVMKALISKGNEVLATGYAEENRTSSTINRTSALENCETSAIGRALAAFGMAGTEYASADEVAQAISNQSSGQTVAPRYNNNEAPKTEKAKAFLDSLKQQIAGTLNGTGLSTVSEQKKFIYDFLGKETVDTIDEAKELLNEAQALAADGSLAGVQDVLDAVGV